ncbi:MAG: chemotaxis protein CheC [Candidatus Nitrosotenuis sp.]
MSTLISLSSEESRRLTSIFDQYITSKTSVALSTLLSEPVEHQIQIFCIANINNIRLDPDEIKMCAVRLNGKGDTYIEILYTIQQKHAKKMAAKLLCVNDICEIDEMGASAIQEVANIMTGSFFNALSNGTGFRVDLSTPNFTNDEFHSLIGTSARCVVNPVEYAVIADVELIGKSSGTKLHMIIMQNPNDARKLLLNHSDSSDEKNDPDSQIQNTKYEIGGSNSELDALLDDILGEKH